MQNPQRFETQWGGKTLSLEVGKYADQAGGSCTIQYGDTVLLATATMSSEPRPGIPFFPLMVDFEEKHYAAGRIKGSRFMKREGRPTDEAVLTSRFIDRALRPLFDQTNRHDVQVIVTSLVFDGENDPDILGLIAASCALHISDIPWAGPIGCVRVGKVDGEIILNPTYEQREKADFDLSFAGTHEKVIMVEAGANEAKEEDILEAFWFGMKNLETPVKLIEQVRAAVGKEKRVERAMLTEEGKATIAKKKEIEDIARPFIVKQVQELFFGAPQATKGDRTTQRNEVSKRLAVFLAEKGYEGDDVKTGTSLVYGAVEAEVSRAIVDEGKRLDGRALDEIRELVSEVSVLPRVHGTGHFKRGETQVLTVVTLGSPGDAQLMDGMEIVGTKKYFHHYNFPPFSVGEVKPMRGPSRRDIGHGGLAEKALRPMMPNNDDFPYTIQAVSEVFGSNGSSSMGATCGSSLALMDAGVPIKAPVAGLAMGLAMNDAGDWKVITDLQDLEDGQGGMDFKIAGSRDGITAIQMDTKTDGLTKEIIEEAITKGKTARNQILDVMQTALDGPRAELSEFAPRIITLRINPELIGNVIGPGGKTINEIIATTGVGAIDIEEDGLVMITSTDSEGAQKALDMVKNLTREVKVGETFKGKVTRVMDFGAIVEFLPKKDGMVHVSELAPWRVNEVGDIVKLGQEVFVKVLEKTPEGRTSLSMKQAEGNVYPERPKQDAQSSAPRRPQSGGGGRDSGKRPTRRPYVPRTTGESSDPAPAPKPSADEEPKRRGLFGRKPKDES